MAAWERFLQNGEVAPNTLRAPIESSWSRCLSAGVDPARVQAPTVLPAEELMTLRALHRELIEASVPIMAQAREFLSASGTILMLTDPRGIILQTEGDPSALEAALDIRLMTGANWTELNCGTNAIGTALSTREPVQVHACEHFCIGIKPWTCSATVVHDPVNGEVLGALDVSGLQRTFNHHCLALVLTAADRIEERLMNREMELGERLLVAGLGRLSRLATGGLLFFDRKGRLIKADARADVSLTAMAIKLESKADTRIDAFSADSSAAVGQPGLPEWLLPEWVEPIIEGGRRIGTIVVLPDPSQGKPLRPVQAEEGPKREPCAARRDRRRLSGSACGAVSGVQGRADKLHRADRRRNRNRQGADRSRHSQTLATCGARLCESELRRHPTVIDHLGIVRSRKRSVYWSPAKAARPIRIS